MCILNHSLSSLINCLNLTSYFLYLPFLLSLSTNEEKNLKIHEKNLFIAGGKGKIRLCLKLTRKNLQPSFLSNKYLRIADLLNPGTTRIGILYDKTILVQNLPGFFDNFLTNFVTNYKLPRAHNYIPLKY